MADCKRKKRKIQLSDHCLSTRRITTPEDSNPPPSDQVPEMHRNVEVEGKTEEVSIVLSMQNPPADEGRYKHYNKHQNKCNSNKIQQKP